jgi:uncharacterized protein
MTTPRDDVRHADAVAEPPVRGGMAVLGSAALVLLIIGGLNWGLVGIAGLDVVAELFGPMSTAARIIYVLVGLAAIYCAVRLPRWSRAG